MIGYKVVISIIKEEIQRKGKKLYNMQMSKITFSSGLWTTVNRKSVRRSRMRSLSIEGDPRASIYT